MGEFEVAAGVLFKRFANRTMHLSRCAPLLSFCFDKISTHVFVSRKSKNFGERDLAGKYLPTVGLILGACDVTNAMDR